MGLACSHNAWRGAYSAFMRWRKMLADVAGLPPLELMEGFFVPLSDERGLPTLYHGMNTREPAFGPGSDPHMAKLDNYLPIRWDCLKPSALHELLYHRVKAAGRQASRALNDKLYGAVLYELPVKIIAGSSCK